MLYNLSKFILPVATCFLISGCSTKIPITNINSNSLIKNKNESIVISSSNEPTTVNFKNNLINDISNNGILLSPPFDYNFVLNGVQHNTNIFNYQSQQEVFVKDEYCEAMKYRQKEYDKYNNNYNKDRNHKDKYNNNYNYNGGYNNYNNYDNQRNNNDCMVKRIELLDCVSVETNSNVYTDTVYLKQNYSTKNVFNSYSKKDKCFHRYDNFNPGNLEYENILDNTSNLQNQIFNYISPNISQVYLNVYDKVESVKLNDNDEDKFENAVDLIDDKNFNTAKNILMNLHDNSINKYGKIPYEITFNLAVICENLNQLNEAKKYYGEIKEINVSNQIQRIDRLTNFRK